MAQVLCVDFVDCDYIYNSKLVDEFVDLISIKNNFVKEETLRQAIKTVDAPWREHKLYFTSGLVVGDFSLPELFDIRNAVNTKYARNEINAVIQEGNSFKDLGYVVPNPDTECAIEESIEKSDDKPCDAVNHPSHYTSGKIEVIDYIRDKMSARDFTSFCQGNVLKYVSRWRDKDGVQDLKKAQVYLNWMIESAEKEES